MQDTSNDTPSVEEESTIVVEDGKVSDEKVISKLEKLGVDISNTDESTLSIMKELQKKALLKEYGAKSIAEEKNQLQKSFEAEKAEKEQTLLNIETQYREKLATEQARIAQTSDDGTAYFLEIVKADSKQADIVAKQMWYKNADDVLKAINVQLEDINPSPTDMDIEKIKEEAKKEAIAEFEKMQAEKSKSSLKTEAEKLIKSKLAKVKDDDLRKELEEDIWDSLWDDPKSIDRVEKKIKLALSSANESLSKDDPLTTKVWKGGGKWEGDGGWEALVKDLWGMDEKTMESLRNVTL